MRTKLFLLLSLVACGASEEEKREKKKECEQIAASITVAAQARGIPTLGACNNPNAPEFKEPCDRLRACNQEFDDM